MGCLPHRRFHEFSPDTAHAGLVVEVSIQADFLFHMRPRDARLCAMRPLGPFNRPGIFNVLNCLAHLPHEGFGLGQLFVQLIPACPRFVWRRNGATHKCLSGHPHHKRQSCRLPVQKGRGNFQREAGICF